MPEINVRQRFNQPPEQVFAALGTHQGLNQLFWPIQVQRVRDATDPQHPDGVGSVRKMGLGWIKPLAEQITAYEPNALVEYTVIGRAPIKHHLGRLTFTADGQGTLVDYHISLESDLPFVAPTVLNGLQLAIRLGLARMARNI
ncbi:MAG: SRPBCC family protein [Pseudomonadota bacterium]|nr:SRPBCC family protein [Pseudomonadota bacterium]